MYYRQKTKRFTIKSHITMESNIIASGEKIIGNRIFNLRGMQVMIDRDLAELYGVETKVLNQAVKRNETRFPNDFMFQLLKEEFENWRSQFVTSNSDRIGQGISMLSAIDF